MSDTTRLHSDVCPPTVESILRDGDNDLSRLRLYAIRRECDWLSRARARIRGVRVYVHIINIVRNIVSVYACTYTRTTKRDVKATLQTRYPRFSCRKRANYTSTLR